LRLAFYFQAREWKDLRAEQKTGLTNAALQEYMQKCIKSYDYKITREHVDQVNTSMAEIWREARTHFSHSIDYDKQQTSILVGPVGQQGPLL